MCQPLGSALHMCCFGILSAAWHCSTSCPLWLWAVDQPVTLKMFAAVDFHLRKSRFGRRWRSWTGKCRCVLPGRTRCNEEAHPLHSERTSELRGFYPNRASYGPFLFAFCRSQSSSSLQDLLVPLVLVKVHSALISFSFHVPKSFPQPCFHVQISAFPQINCLDFGGI